MSNALDINDGNFEAEVVNSSELTIVDFGRHGAVLAENWARCLMKLLKNLRVN